MAETEGQPASGDEVRPQETETPKPEAVKPPRNDAEAAAQEAAAKEAPKPEAPKPEEPKPKRNRTGEYIQRLQQRNKELSDALDALKAKQPEKTPEPTLDQFNFDPAAHAKATAEWAAKQAVGDFQFKQQQETAQRRIQEVTDGYNAKVAEFAASHPDFVQKVNAIPYQLSQAVELAIQAHDQGPDIAYALANDDDLAFQLASIQPHMAAAAVDRIASRLTAAPEAPQPVAPQPIPQTPAKPVSSAPPPVPTVSGKTPTETPPEKLTDAQWWARRQKRAS